MHDSCPYFGLFTFCSVHTFVSDWYCHCDLLCCAVEDCWNPNTSWPFMDFHSKSHDHSTRKLTLLPPLPLPPYLPPVPPVLPPPLPPFISRLQSSGPLAPLCGHSCNHIMLSSFGKKRKIRLFPLSVFKLGLLLPAGREVLSLSDITMTIETAANDFLLHTCVKKNLNTRMNTGKVVPLMPSSVMESVVPIWTYEVHSATFPQLFSENW